MTYLKKTDIKDAYTESKKESQVWKENYEAFERLMDNGLMEGLDPNLPEVNDGSLAAALFKLPKRIVSSKLTGRAKVMTRDEAWMTELANMVWTNKIVPNANSQAPFIRKWKDAVRKAAGYGSVPIINFFTTRGNYTGSDFIVAQPQDVILEAGKVSDYDSDVIFWEVYYSPSQLKQIIKDAKKEKPSKGKESYNQWDTEELQKILDSKQTTTRDGNDVPLKQQETDVKPKGYKFVVVVQRGVESPFYMYYPETDKVVREWSNPDPTGDIPIHYLYCYQDFVNPYGIGIVKLAGGTQNVLDYMRQADVLATQLGLRPPINIQGDADSADLESLVYAQDAMWFTGQAIVKREELANGVYAQLPSRIMMYKTSLNQLIPLGDISSTQAGSGDPQQSKTPAGVRFQAANLSIDDEDFKDNLYVTYEAVAKSMINTHFANMEGSDLMKLSDDEREILIKAGMEFPEDENGEMSNEMEIVWDTARGEFDFEVEAEKDLDTERKEKLEGFTQVAQLVASDPSMQQKLAESGKKLNEGELFSEMIKLISDNDKIITDIGPEDEQVDPMTGQPIPQQQPQQNPIMDLKAQQEQQKIQQSDELHQLKKQKMQMSMQPKAPEGVQGQEMGQGSEVSEEEIQANIEAVMQEYGVDENTALAALSAEAQGTPKEDIMAALKQVGGQNVQGR